MDRVSKTEIKSNLFCWPKRVSCCNNIASYDDNIVVFWQFFSAGDYRLTDNRTIIISRSPFRSWTGHLLPPFSWYSVSSLFTLPDRRSFHLYFGTLATLTREFPWLRYPPGGEPIGFCLLHLSLVSSHSFFLPPLLSLSHSFSLSLLAAHRRFCSRSLSSTRYRRLVHQSDAIMTSGENEKRTRRSKTDCTHGCILHSSTDSRDDRTFALTLRTFTFDVLSNRKFPLWTKMRYSKNFFYQIRQNYCNYYKIAFTSPARINLDTC